MNRTFVSVALLLTLLVFGSVTTAYGNARWVSLKGTSSPERPSSVVLNSNQQETVIKISINGFFSEEKRKFCF